MIIKENNKVCPICNKGFYIKPSHAHLRVTCGRACSIISQSLNTKGENNNNFKNAGVRNCIQCNKEFKSYNKKTKFCSRSCYGKSDGMRERLLKYKDIPRKKRAKKEKVIIPKVKRVYVKKIPVPNKVCGNCKIEYHSYNKKSKYCSYKCSLEAGTAFKAGMNSTSSRMRYGAKKDINHNKIVEEFKKRNCGVMDLSGVGKGMPDLLVNVNGVTLFVEVKNRDTAYGKRGLNKMQKVWAENWEGAAIYIVYDEIDVENMVNNKLHLVRSYGGYGSAEINR